MRGAISIGQIVEITSHLKEKKKIKSIQMFRKPVRCGLLERFSLQKNRKPIDENAQVQRATQGDRVGVCVAGLNPKTVERGIVAAPDTVHNLIYRAFTNIISITHFKLSTGTFDQRCALSDSQGTILST